MSSCTDFITKWFDGPQKTVESLKKEHIRKVVTASYTLTSNNSMGLVTYASSPGINSLLRSMLWFISTMDGPHIVLSYSTLNGDATRPEDLYIPTVDTLFSSARKGRLVVGSTEWGPSDRRQPFDVDASQELLLSITYSHGEIKVVGKFKKKITSISRRRSPPWKNFEFVATCLGSNILLGYTGSTAYLLSFNKIYQFDDVYPMGRASS